MKEDSDNREKNDVANGGDEPVDGQKHEQIEDDAGSPRRSKKTLVVAGLAAVLVVGVAVAFFVRANLDDSPDTTMVNGHEVLPTITGHDPTESFCFELTDRGRRQVTERTNDGAELENFVAVFTDDEFSNRARSRATWGIGELEVEPLERADAAISRASGLAEDFDERNLPIRGGDEQEWGIYETYYFVQYIDEDGEDLDTPLVQPYTMDIDVLDPVDSFDISEPDDDGNVEFSWDPVDGADTYLIVGSEYSPEPVFEGLTDYTVVGETSDAHWDSVDTQTSSDREMYELEPERLTQNNGLGTYAVVPGNYQMGVIATDGQRFSHYVPRDVTENLRSLPYRNDVDQWEERVDRQSHFDSLAELEDVVMPYVTLDGSVEDTVMQVDTSAEIHTTWTGWNQSEEFDEIVRRDKERYRVPIQGVGTMLKYEVQVEITDDDIDDQIDEFNEAQLELAEELGISID